MDLCNCLVFELRPSHFHFARPLFKDVWADRALLDSVFEGHCVARIFVDAVPEPTAVLLCEQEGNYYLAGDSSPGFVRQFVKDMPAEAEVFDHAQFAYFLPDVSWVQTLKEDFQGALRIHKTRSFRFVGSTIKLLDFWKEDTRKDIQVKVIDADLLNRIARHDVSICLEFNPGLIEYIFNNQFGYCILVDDKIASVVWAYATSSRYASISVDTSESFRRLGLATLGSVALIRKCLNLKLLPIWASLASNKASIATALKLGMEEGPAQHKSDLRSLWNHIKAEGGRWSKDVYSADENSIKAIFRRL